MNTQKVDGAVALSPYLIRFTPGELLDYFVALADVSKRPLYLYDLPGLTGTKLQLDTVLELASHPNIRGIKCSGDVAWTRQLIEAAPPGFRVIVAQADLINMLLRESVNEHLDGIFSLAPAWISRIAKCAQAGNWNDAADAQARVSELLRVIKSYGVFPTFTYLLDAQEFLETSHRRHSGNWAKTQFTRVRTEPIVSELLDGSASVGLRPDELASRSSADATASGRIGAHF